MYRNVMRDCELVLSFLYVVIIFIVYNIFYDKFYLICNKKAEFLC